MVALVTSTAIKPPHISAIDGQFPGARRIRTNANTAAAIADLNLAIAWAQQQGKPFAIVPDFVAYWVKSKQQNVLPAAWPQRVELADDRLIRRVTGTLTGRCGNLIVLVEEFDATNLRQGFTPIPDSDFYVIVDFVKDAFPTDARNAVLRDLSVMPWAPHRLPISNLKSGLATRPTNGISRTLCAALASFHIRVSRWRSRTERS